MTTRIEKAVNDSVIKQDILNLQEEIVQLIYKTLNNNYSKIKKTLIDSFTFNGEFYEIYLEHDISVFYDEEEHENHLQEFTQIYIEQDNHNDIEIQDNVQIFTFNFIGEHLYSSTELDEYNIEIVLFILKELVKDI
ncbi:MAG: hypothetical protein ACLURU_00430 [Finegoldia magna]